MTDPDVEYQWAVRRYDIGDEPVILFPDRRTEAQARSWYESLLRDAQFYNERHPEDPMTLPELVCAPMHWEVVS